MVTRILLVLLTCVALTACEAPLVLDKVEQSKQASIHRTDRMQAAASNGEDVVVAGIGFILNSNDLGKTWQRTQPNGLPSFIGATVCPNKTQVVVSAEKQAWVSTDNGKTWSANNIGTEEAPQYISCGPDNKIWIAASFSTLLSSADQGKTWQSVSLDEDLIFTYINFFDAQNGLAIGEFGSVYTSIDAGKSWVPKEEPIPNEFYPLAVSFADASNGWIGGSSGVIMHTNDGGNTWVKEATSTDAPIYGLLANASGVYATGGFGTLLERALSPEGLAVWTRSDAVSSRSYLRAIAAIGSDAVLIGGGAGTLSSLESNGSGRLVAATAKQGE